MPTPINRVEEDRWESYSPYQLYGPENESYADWLRRYHANVEVARQRQLARARWFARAA